MKTYRTIIKSGPKRGYVKLYVYCSIKQNVKYIGYEHRVLYEQYHNIKIPKGFDIHHLNGNRSDNSIENLLCIRKDHHRLLHKTKKPYEMR